MNNETEHTPTPRTNAIARQWSTLGGMKNGSDASPEAKELYCLARQLERELAEARAENERLAKLADDRLQRCAHTSGLLQIVLNAAEKTDISEELQTSDVIKEYVARASSLAAHAKDGERWQWDPGD